MAVRFHVLSPVLIHLRCRIRCLAMFHCLWIQMVKCNRDMLCDFCNEHGRFYSAFSRG